MQNGPSCGPTFGYDYDLCITNDARGWTDKKLTSTLVIRPFLSFELADIFLKYGSRLFFKKAKKTLISILIANNEANTTP